MSELPSDSGGNRKKKKNWDEPLIEPRVASSHLYEAGCFQLPNSSLQEKSATAGAMNHQWHEQNPIFFSPQKTHFSYLSYFERSSLGCIPFSSTQAERIFEVAAMQQCKNIQYICCTRAHTLTYCIILRWMTHNLQKICPWRDGS